jgi:hypothetical protein
LKVRVTAEKPGEPQVPVPPPPLGELKLTLANPLEAHHQVPEKECSEVPAGAVNLH